eukprot:2185487-Rhodomonas_salina.1
MAVFLASGTWLFSWPALLLLLVLVSVSLPVYQRHGFKLTLRVPRRSRDFQDQVKLATARHTRVTVPAWA